MNKVILIGNLTRDPELSTSQQGISYCRFGIAVNRRFSNANENNEVDFFNVIAWRTTAENCAKFLRKGKKVAVFGMVQIRKYDKDGQERQAVEISADEVEFLSPRDSFDDGYAPAPKSDYNNGGGYKRRDVSELEPVDDDLPF